MPFDFYNALALLSLLAWGYLALGNGLFWLPVKEGDEATPPASWPSVAIIIPARNEADSLEETLSALFQQDYQGAWHIILVDDNSTDKSADVAYLCAEKKNAQEKLTILHAPPLKTGWSGKVAAMDFGVHNSASDYILFTDADITHDPHSLTRLMAKSVHDKLDLHSLMVKLACSSTAEKLLIPAFVFFFAMLYPFRRANNPSSKIAAAAGGVMCLRRQALANIGGMAAIKSALIDDCSLAKEIKRHGGDKGTRGRIRLTLTDNVTSQRPYPTFASVMHMIARTAFTQLHYSTLLLVGCIAGLGLTFLAPVGVFLFGGWHASVCGLATWFIMAALYMPMVLFYELSPLWALTLPLAAVVYLIATCQSAVRFWRGRGGQWKNRSQAISS